MSKNQKTPKKRSYRVDKELWALLIKSMILFHAEGLQSQRVTAILHLSDSEAWR